MSMMTDLATVHGLVSDLFLMPETPAQSDGFRLTEEQVTFFQENGYVAGIPILNDTQIETLREALAALMHPSPAERALFYEYHANESADPNAVLFHALGAWRVAPAFHDVLWHPAFVRPASQLLGDVSVRFWHDQLFCKPAHHGGVVAWHQDYAYWTRTVPMAHLTCWIGLDDADEKNGCLHYIPGSHRWGLLEKPALTGDMDEIYAYLSEEQKAGFQPVPIPLKKGYATFHHPLLLHGSYENRTNHSRRAFVLNVVADGVCTDTDEVLLGGVPALPQGRPLNGKFFPLLYDA